MSQDSNTCASSAQHAPPNHLKDPFVRRLPDSRARWSRVLRGRIPKPMDALVARTLADYGNKDGSNCHPGVNRLAEDCCISVASVKRSLSWLAEHGWISLEKRCARKLGLADVWQLTLPAPVAVELGVWPEATAGPQWTERPSNEPKRPGMRDRPGPSKPGRKPKVLGLRDSVVGLSNSVSRAQSCEPTPGPTHQVLSSHQSEFLTRPQSDVWGDEEDLHEQIEERAEEQLGHVLYTCTSTMIGGMLSTGAHPKAVLNAVLARERDPDPWAQGA